MRAALGALSALILGSTPALAQQGDAFVVPRGVARLRVAGEYTHASSRFAGGGTEPLAAGFAGPLTSARFAPLLPLESSLTRFFEATAGQPGAQPVAVGPGTLTAGVLDADVAANWRRVPLELTVGVLPRIEIGVSVPLLREEVVSQRMTLAGGTVGRNPNRDENARRLAALGAQWRALGQSSLLPTAGSALGQELQRRVRTATGQELLLPSSPADTALFNELLGSEFDGTALGAGLNEWRLGDAEVSARVQLLNTLGTRSLPADSAPVHYRVALGVGARLPTGATPGGPALLSLLPESGVSGLTVTGDADLFVGRLWATASGRLASRGEVEALRRTAPADAPLAAPARPSTVRWTPPTELELRLAPRFRLTDAIAVGAEYALVRRGETSLRVVGDGTTGETHLPSGSTQLVGGGIRYSAVDATGMGRSGLPLEVTLAYRRAVSGADFEPVGSTLVLAGTLYRPLWGAR